MNRRICLTLCMCVLAGVAAWGHVTPTVQLERRGDFIRDNLPGATHFFERKLDESAMAALAKSESRKWRPSAREIKVYVGRDADGHEIGAVVFLRVPSEHGPVGLGVAFDAGGVILRAAVMEVGSEPLAWVQPLIDAGGLNTLKGLRAGQPIEAEKLAAGVKGSMSHYYAGIVAKGVARAGAVLEAAGLVSKNHDS